MQENGKLSKDLNEKVQEGYPGNHIATGKAYKELEAQKPLNREKLDKLKNLTQEHDAKLEAARTVFLNRQAPQNNLNPPRMSSPSAVKPKDFNNFRKMAIKNTQHEASKIVAKGKAKEDFDRSR